MPTFPTRHEEMAVRERERERQQAKSTTSMLLKDDFFQGSSSVAAVGGGGGATARIMASSGSAIKKRPKLYRVGWPSGSIDLEQEDSTERQLYGRAVSLPRVQWHVDRYMHMNNRNNSNLKMLCLLPLTMIRPWSKSATRMHAAVFCYFLDAFYFFVTHTSLILSLLSLAYS